MNRVRWVASISAVGYAVAGALAAALGVIGWVGCFAPTPGVVCRAADASAVIAAFVPFILAGALFAGAVAVSGTASAIPPRACERRSRLRRRTSQMRAPRLAHRFGPHQGKES